MPPNHHVAVLPATAADVPDMLELIQGLADYERESNAVKITPRQLHDALFGDKPAAEAVLARYQGEVAGWALWYQTYSTWTGTPGLWLEDLFVWEKHRKRGIGHALMAYLARLCLDRGYARLEWSVLDWNTPSIDFYSRLGATGMSEWNLNRLTGEALTRLADETQ